MKKPSKTDTADFAAWEQQSVARVLDGSKTEQEAIDRAMNTGLNMRLVQEWLAANIAKPAA